MAEYIDKDEMEEKLRKISRYYFDRYYADRTDSESYNRALGYDRAADKIRMTITADAQTVRYGRWIDLDGRILCSYCGSGYDDTDEVKIYTYLFCPNCGAKMSTE